MFLLTEYNTSIIKVTNENIVLKKNMNFNEYIKKFFLSFNWLIDFEKKKRCFR